MTNSELEIVKLRAASARERMLGTAQELQYRLKPSTIADGAKEALRRKGTELAEDAVIAVANRPVVVSATVAGFGALLGAGLFTRWRRGRRDQDQETS